MSLLLAFFVLLFSFSSMDKAVYKEVAGSMKDAFGVQREIKVTDSPKGINIIAREFSPGIIQPSIINEVRQMTTHDSKPRPVFKEEKETNDDSLSEEDLEIMKKIKRDSELLREVIDKEISVGLIDIKVTQKRIILMVREKGSFASGSAKIIKPFEIVARKIGKVFNDFEGKIIVSGHTDNIPIHTNRFRSNWELSSSRAVSVIHQLAKEKELKNKNFEIAAYADTKPVDSNDTEIGRSKNRRVEIMMDYSKMKVGEKLVASSDIFDNEIHVSNELGDKSMVLPKQTEIEPAMTKDAL
jgi:chemotaxis protein MotB